MLIVETIARIRREHFIKGKTIKEIARDLKVSRNTDRKVLRSGETTFWQRESGRAAAFFPAFAGLPTIPILCGEGELVQIQLSFIGMQFDR
jgi:hypothetical protein